MPSQMSYIAPKTNTPRPPLPLSNANPLIKNIERSKAPPVKYQVITREGQEIVVGRVKIQTPDGGHAFILRRFDTGAVSLTTMFRAAFPTATEDAEKAESAWVKANYDLTGTNGTGREPSTHLRLAGTWVTPEVAVSIADVYALGNIIPPLASASPDPSENYRHSTKREFGLKPSSFPSSQSEKNSVSPTPSAPNPSKRRKESSPTIAPLTLPTPAPARAPSPSVSSSGPLTRRGAAATRASSKPPSRGTRSRAGTAKVQQPLTPAPSDQNIIEEEGDDIAEVPGPDMKADIEEQKTLIESLKAERAAAAASGSLSSERQTKSKRALEETEDELKFDFKEPEAGERQIKSNRRIRLQPQQKSAAWGVAFFAVGFAAMAALPNFLF